MSTLRPSYIVLANQPTESKAGGKNYLKQTNNTSVIHPLLLGNSTESTSSTQQSYTRCITLPPVLLSTHGHGNSKNEIKVEADKQEKVILEVNYEVNFVRNKEVPKT